MRAGRADMEFLAGFVIGVIVALAAGVLYLLESARSGG